MAFTVNTYESPAKLSDILGLPVLPNLDDSLLNDLIQPADTVVCGGGLFTLIQGALPVGTQVLAKGLYYSVIVETL